MCWVSLLAQVMNPPPPHSGAGQVKRKTMHGETDRIAKQLSDYFVEHTRQTAIMMTTTDTPYGFVSKRFQAYSVSKGASDDVKLNSYSYRVNQMKVILEKQQEDFELEGVHGGMPATGDKIIDINEGGEGEDVDGDDADDASSDESSDESSEDEEDDGDGEDMDVEASEAAAKEKKRRRGGRPKSEEKKKAKELSIKITDCRNFIVHTILEAAKVGKTLSQIATIKDAEMRYGLEPKSVSQSSVQYRVRNKVDYATKPGTKGPLEGGIEDFLVNVLSQHATFGYPMNRADTLSLVNNMLAGTDLEKSILEKKERETNECTDGSTLGKRWFKSFLRRHKSKLHSAYPQLFDGKRSTWTVLENFILFYDRLDAAILKGGLGVRPHVLLLLCVSYNN